MTVSSISSVPSKSEHIDTLLPESTRLYVGPGITIKGDIHFQTEQPDQRLVICGDVEGNISTNGVLQIAEGAIVRGNTTIDCAEIVVAGTLTGESVTIKARLLFLLATGNIAVDKLCLPPGGLEQSRGGVLNARLDMSAEYGAVPDLKSIANPTPSEDSKPAAGYAGRGFNSTRVMHTRNEFVQPKTSGATAESSSTAIVVPMPTFNSNFDNPNSAPVLDLPNDGNDVNRA